MSFFKHNAQNLSWAYLGLLSRAHRELHSRGNPCAYHCYVFNERNHNNTGWTLPHEALKNGWCDSSGAEQQDTIPVRNSCNCLRTITYLKFAVCSLEAVLFRKKERKGEKYGERVESWKWHRLKLWICNTNNLRYSLKPEIMPNPVQIWPSNSSRSPTFLRNL
jgi:hypothetical protein